VRASRSPCRLDALAVGAVGRDHGGRVLLHGRRRAVAVQVESVKKIHFGNQDITFHVQGLTPASEVGAFKLWSTAFKG
jgi:hypothetical protein